MKALPLRRYEYAEWARHKVNIDYHVEIGRHYYSVPYQLRQQTVDARVTASTVEIFFRGKRVASHVRNPVPGRHTTVLYAGTKHSSCSQLVNQYGHDIH